MIYSTFLAIILIYILIQRTYGPWWDKAPSRSIDYMPQNNTDVVSQDYIGM